MCCSVCVAVCVLQCVCCSACVAACALQCVCCSVCVAVCVLRCVCCSACVAVRVLQCVCCSACVAVLDTLILLAAVDTRMRCGVVRWLWCGAVRCSVLQCIAVCYSAQCTHITSSRGQDRCVTSSSHRIRSCCSVLQFSSVLQCVAVCCSRGITHVPPRYASAQEALPRTHF